jgi:endonuclease-8
MPEGHTIHRIAKDQTTELVGHPIHTDAVQDRFRADAAALDGRVLDRVEAWGKHLFQHWDGHQLVHIHLGLIGKWRRSPTPPPAMFGQCRLRLVGPERTWDLAGAMRCAVIEPAERKAIIATLGPDPLRRSADPERMWAKLQRSTKPMGALLLDQAVVAGIGNVYRAELLWLVNVAPQRAGKDLTRDEFDALWAEMVRQLRLGVRRNKIVTRSNADLPTSAAKVGRKDAVYAYQQEHCVRCGSTMHVEEMGGRRIWWCPVCQPG